MQSPKLILAYGLTAGSLYYWAQTDPSVRFTAYLWVHLALFLGMLGLTAKGLSLRASLLWGSLLRLLLIGVPIFTSYDVSRYLWDGFVVTQGLDPYSHTPQSLSHLFNQWPPPRDNLQFPGIYPPLSMALLGLCAKTPFPWWAWKTLTTLASIATLFGVAKVLLHEKKTPYLPLVAFNPLLILESGVGAHLDALVGLAVIAAVWAIKNQRSAYAAGCLALGTLVKFSPVVCFAAWMGSLFWRRRWDTILRCAGIYSGLIALTYSIAWMAGWHSLGSLSVFFKQWQFGSPLAALADFFLEQGTANLFRLGLLGTVLILISRRSENASQVWQWSFIALFALSPVCFPWYLIPLQVLCVFSATRFSLLWALAAPFTYEVMTAYEVDGIWSPAVWPLGLVGLAWVLGILPLDRLPNLPAFRIFRTSRT